MPRPRAALALLLLLMSACATHPAPGPHPSAGAEPYDLLIRGGHIVDGSGSPWFRGDVAVRGDRIAAVGLLPHATARDTIDARGLVVAPGFIDMLGHSEYSLLRDGRAISKITQGITSEITGEVSSVVPVNERTLAGQGRGTRELIDWTDLEGYFRSLERRGTAINLGTFVTAGSVRRAVMGDVDRAPTPEELAAMRREVAAAMRQGAMGLSTGMIYAPASFASTEELVALAEEAARHGGGYASHIRSEGDGLIDAIEEAIEVGERAGTWVQIHHLKAAGRPNWGRMPQAVATIEAARARGVDVSADQYPYPAAGTNLHAVLPGWAHEGGVEALLGRLRDPQTRERLRRELSAPDGGGSDWSLAAVGGPEGVMIAGVRSDSLRGYQGRRLSEVAGARGQSPIDALFDLILSEGGGVSAVYFAMSEEDIEYAMRQPWVSIGVDAGARAADSTITERPHPRAYGTFPRVLCRYVRERGVIPLEDAIRKFTALPAARVGLADRGVLKAGLYADITVFDPQRVCDRATFEEPVQASVGIEHVIVNGVPVLRGGTPTGARPGRGLRRAP